MPVVKSKGPEYSSPLARAYLKALIYAPAGMGKTTLLGSAEDDARTAPIAYLDYEGGTQSLSDRPDIHIYTIRDWADFNEIYAYLASGSSPYKSVALDSISEAHIMALLARLASDIKTRKDPDLVDQNDYGIALVQMRRFLRSFRDLPMHVFTSSTDKKDTDPREGMIIKPSLAGAMADEVQAIFDLVGYLSLATIKNEETDEEEVHRVLLLQNYPKYRTKVRVPPSQECPDEIIDPTITSILDTLNFPMPTRGKKSSKEE